MLVVGNSTFARLSLLLLLLGLFVIDGRDGHIVDDEDLLRAIQEAHPLWMRERCRSPFYADPDTRQPKYNLHEEVDDLSVVSVRKADSQQQQCEHQQEDISSGDLLDGYVVEFSDKQCCFFSTDIIRAELNNERTFLQALKWDFPPPFFWDRQTLQAPPTFEYNDVIQQHDNNSSNNNNNWMNGYTDQSRKFLSVLISTGIALVQNVPRQAGECVRFGEQFSSLRDTEWGIFNVRSTPDTASGGVVRKDLAYTSNSIGMHVDSPYRVDTPPAFQLLHAIEHCHAASPDGCYVHNHFVDGFRVAHDFCQTNRELFDTLTSVVLRWENNGGDDSSLLYRYAPMIELEERQDNSDISCPAVKAINFSAKSGGYAPKLSRNDLDLFYKAKRTFSAMLHDDQYTVRFQLYPGALVIFDNRRILHSRSSIAPTDGERWLQGCYLNRDGVLYLYEQLRRHYNQLLTETPFTTLKQATKADYDRMGEEYDQSVIQKTRHNLLNLLQHQKHAYLGAPVSLLEHNVQTASRAMRAGEDDETIFISLFHDVFETLAVKNHGELASAMLAPWISPKSQWLLAHHEIFQGHYYFHHYDIDPNLRDIFQNHPYYDWTVAWCELYDQASFDPDYVSLPIEWLMPVVERVLARPQYWWNPSHPKAGAVSNSSVNTTSSATTTTSTRKNGTCEDTWTCYGDAIENSLK